MTFQNPTRRRPSAAAPGSALSSFCAKRLLPRSDSYNLALPQQLDHRLAAVAERFPDRGAPRMNRCIALRSSGHGKHVGSGEEASVVRQREGRPGPLPLGEVHMHSLDLLPRKLLLDVE